MVTPETAQLVSHSKPLQAFMQSNHKWWSAADTAELLSPDKLSQVKPKDEVVPAASTDTASVFMALYSYETDF